MKRVTGDSWEIAGAAGGASPAPTSDGRRGEGQGGGEKVSCGVPTGSEPSGENRTGALEIKGKGSTEGTTCQE